MIKKSFYTILFLFFGLIALHAQQIKVSGRVYLGDSANHKPKAGVLVRTTSGARGFTNDSGNYNITMSMQDTLEFFYKGKLASAYPYPYLTSFNRFDVMIDENSGFANGIHDLGTVRVYAQTSQDSLRDRQMYGDVFNRKKSRISMGNNKLIEHDTIMGTRMQMNTMDKKLSLLDIGSVANYLNKQKKTSQKVYQKFANQNEQSAYIQRRFTKSIIAKYTGMQADDSLTYFMGYYAPTFANLKSMSELELGQYILDNAKKFREEGMKKENQ